ncbi:MAG: hypothetical protein NTV86_06845 [Planctomycetota bacterium]|nr:hypothetical protein [Planctomycetota bacterium]
MIAYSRSALTAAVDAALDNVGGLPPGGKTVAMAELEGEGALLARIDMARVTGTFLPLLGAVFGSNSDFPLAPLPPTNKIVSMLGSEVVLFQATDCGILLKSRGHVPLLTKAPLAGYGVLFFIFRGMFG